MKKFVSKKESKTMVELSRKCF